MSEKYEDLRAKFDAEMRDRIENPLKHMARRDLADELQHCIDDTNVGQPNRYVSVSLLERAISRIRELEDDRDSWAEQASQRVADWQREHDLRVAAERRVSELERASLAGSGEAGQTLLALLERVSNYHHYYGSRVLPKELVAAIDAAMQRTTAPAHGENGGMREGGEG
ncbi:hypothetical protein DFLDMN_001534 [Cupriavidus sp. H19C3]|uniref:hypothetical protein n=1 Tax=Cupriavidus sp. H19C3 TaxID=3241603 RepID=UPI003BF8735C